MSKTLGLLILAVASIGCERDNSYYCADAPHHNCFAADATPVPDAPPDVTPPCMSNQDCSGDTSVCDLHGTKMCVHCTATDHLACTGATPTCPSDNVCSACTAHSQCDSKACLPDGSCGDDLNVAYVDPTGVGTTCTSAMPCKKVSDALATNRPFVKFHDTTDEAVTIDNGRTVTLLADPGAKLTRTKNGLLLELRGASQVTIYDLEIVGASGVGSPGISIPAGSNSTLTLIRASIHDNAGAGISATGGSLTALQSTINSNQSGGISFTGSGSLTVGHSTISGNTGSGISITGGGKLVASQSTILSNTGGGIAITGAQYDLTNNIIAKNGTPGSSLGGVLVFQITTPGAHVFDFNTIASNIATNGITPGVTCALISTPLAFTDSIVYENGGGTQVDGDNCNWSYSDIAPTPAMGANNISVDPLFVAPGQSNFHLQPTSPARDAAGDAPAIVVDIDSDVRPQGPARDMGADEVKP